jgi:hypothetical protein
MKDAFKKWMKDEEKKKPGVVSAYAGAINNISRHYSEETGKNIAIYRVNDLPLLKQICKEYRRGGRYEDFGDLHNGLNRAAISAYIRFIEYTKKENRRYELTPSGNNVEIIIKKKINQDITIRVTGETSKE